MTKRMFEWDEAKNAANVIKHGIGFEFAIRIFDGPVWTVVDDRAEYGERRSISVGRIDDVAIVTLVHTDRRGRTRIISARPASQRERRRYEQEASRADDRGRDRGNEG